jgi:RNA polymerase sigma factor (sigma-70 family)
MFFDPSEIRTLIHAATKRTGTPLHDEDLEQDVALRALEAFRRLHDVTHPRALLMKIVRDSVRDYWRRRRWLEELSSIDETLFCHVPLFESNLDRERRLDLLRSALNQLPLRKKQLLESFYLADRSIPEIAATAGRSISAIKMDLVRSRRTLLRIYDSLAMKRTPQSVKSTTKRRE